jgi:ATP-dependent metalloprotease
MVTQLPDKDETSVSLRQMRARLDVCMGGRVAEELVFGADAVTSGARSDLQQATALARHMVSECGMSDAIGPMYLADSASGRFKPSADTERAVDEEVRRLLKESYDRVRLLLKASLPELHSIANALLEQETLTGDQVKAIVAASAGSDGPSDVHGQASAGAVSLPV